MVGDFFEEKKNVDLKMFKLFISCILYASRTLHAPGILLL
jgi:hypothetical protein